MPAVPPEPSRPARGGRTRVTAEQRAAAANRVLDDGVPVAEIATSLGVHPSTVRRWVREAVTARTSTDLVAGSTVRSDPGTRSVAPGRAPPAGPEAAPGAEVLAPEVAAVDVPAVEPEALALEVPVAPEIPAPEPQPERREPQPPPPEPPPVLQPSPAPASSEPVQLPGSVDPDRIMPLVDRLRSTHRYVIVVLAWGVMLGISVLLPPPGALSGVLQFGHLLGLALAVGGVAVIDWHGLLWLKRRRELRETARIAAAVSPLIWAGLLLLGLTGAALKPDLGALVPWVKMVAVLVVALNGVAASETRQVLRRAAEGITLGAMPRVLAVRMVGSAILSQLAWLTTIVIGVATHVSRV